MKLTLSKFSCSNLDTKHNFENHTIFNKIKDSKANFRIVETISEAQAKVKYLEKLFDPDLSEKNIKRLKKNLVLKLNEKLKQGTVNSNNENKSLLQNFISRSVEKKTNQASLNNDKKNSKLSEDCIYNKSYEKGGTSSFKTPGREKQSKKKISLRYMIEMNKLRKMNENKLKLRKAKPVNQVVVENTKSDKNEIKEIDETNYCNDSLDEILKVPKSKLTLNLKSLRKNTKYDDNSINSNQIVSGNITTSSFPSLIDRSIDKDQKNSHNLKTTQFSTSFSQSEYISNIMPKTSRSTLNIRRQLHDLILDCSSTDKSVNSHLHKVNSQIERLKEKENFHANKDLKDDIAVFGSLASLKEKLRTGFFTYTSVRKNKNEATFVTIDKTDVMCKYEALNSISERSSHKLKDKLMLEFGMKRVNSEKKERAKLIEVTRKKSENISKFLDKIDSKRSNFDTIVNKHRNNRLEKSRKNQMVFCRVKNGEQKIN